MYHLSLCYIVNMDMFTICSCNIYQLPFFTDMYRLKYFCKKISAINPTVVCIQEAWTTGVVRKICTSLHKTHPFSVSPQSHPVLKRSGLLIMAKRPIQLLDFTAFRFLGGFPDCITQKGIATVTICDVILSVTHNIASYVKFPTIAPIKNLRLIKKVLVTHNVDVLVGDLNVTNGGTVAKFLGGQQTFSEEVITDRILSNKVDYCIVLKSLQCVSSRIVSMRGISDHDMLYSRMISLRMPVQK